MKRKTKVAKDLVHEYITLDEECQKIIDTPSFQKLKRVSNLCAIS